MKNNGVNTIEPALVLKDNPKEHIFQTHQGCFNFSNYDLSEKFVNVEVIHFFFANDSPEVLKEIIRSLMSYCIKSMSSQGVWFLFESFFLKKEDSLLKLILKKVVKGSVGIKKTHKVYTKILFRLYVCFKSKYEKLSQQLKKFAQETKDQKDKINSLNAEKSVMFEKIEVCNLLKQTNAQLSSEVQDLRGRICKLTIGLGIESKFPVVNDIATTYEGISDNYRLNLTSEIITQLEDNEKIKETYAMSFLARFSHC
ncbi:hypothetical protein RFI_27740, partial [Reticulomyxa filosa]